MSLGIKVEALAGDQVEDTARCMLRLANTLHVRVMCDFNDVVLSMPPAGSVDQLVGMYNRAVVLPEGSVKMAFG